MVIGAAVHAGALRERLVVQRSGIELTRSSWLGRRRFEAGADEVEQVVVGLREGDHNRSPDDRREVVSVRTDDGFVEFGATVSSRERAWMRDLVLHFLAA